MIKLHLHKKDKKQYGHLYSDIEDIDELYEAGKYCFMTTDMKKLRKWIQFENFTHYDLWAAPLNRAIGRYPIVDNRQFVKEVKGE